MKKKKSKVGIVITSIVLTLLVIAGSFAGGIWVYGQYFEKKEDPEKEYYLDLAEKYSEVISKTDVRIRKEIISYNEFFEKYRESVASDVSGAVNDTYLKSQGQKEGTKSYGMVVDLAVAYYKQKSE